jgi:hypothetical protein
MRFGYSFAWDVLEVTVEEDPTLHFSSCNMRVVLKSDPSVTWAKSIVGWNYFTNSPVGEVKTSGSDHGPHEMIVSHGRCSAGAHTLLLRKSRTIFNVMTGLYTLYSDDLWTYWGGKKVTFTWLADDDRSGSGKWGADTPNPTYPIMASSRVVKSDARPSDFFLVVGGAYFLIGDANAAAGYGLSTTGVFSETVRLLPAPFDFTLVKEFSRPEVYITFGGAKFLIPSPGELRALGFDFNQVNLVPTRTLAGIPGIVPGISNLPRDGTLLRERNSWQTYIMMGGKLHWIIDLSVFQGMCLSWRNVRVVPIGALGSLPHGSDLTAPTMLSTPGQY